MIRKELITELEADIRNRLTFPRVIFGCLMAGDSSIKYGQVKKAIDGLQGISSLFKGMPNLTSEERVAIKVLIEGEISYIRELASAQGKDPIIQKYVDTLSNIKKKFERAAL